MPLQATSGAASYDAFGGGVAAVPQYIEDVFSTYLYTGDSSTQTITNGIDLSTKGGLVWIKARQQTDGSTSPIGEHGLWDTNRGVGTSGSVNKALSSNATSAENLGWTDADYISAFNTTGFTVQNAGGTTTHRIANHAFQNYASWTFRKQPKFFDVVTYTGNGTAGRTVAHNLGSVPGCIIVKRTDTAEDWGVYHTSLGNTKAIFLNYTSASDTNVLYWNNTSPTSTQFSVGSWAGVNANGGTYVAYLFAHNAGGFGLTGTDNVISCGSYTGNGSTTGPEINLGYEPQWVMVKNTTTTGTAWRMFDNMRGFTTDGVDNALAANSSAAEVTYTAVAPTATGFRLTGITSDPNRNGDTYIYIAIRRGPMKVPTSGTSVFSPAATRAATGGTSSTLAFTSNFPVDMFFQMDRNGSGNAQLVGDRLRGSNWLQTASTAAESSSLWKFDSNSGIYPAETLTATSQWGAEMFRRAPSFFDEVCYTGTGSLRTVSHNLGAVPELLIVKRRNTVEDWNVYSATTGNAAYLRLNTTAAVGTAGADALWGSTTPTSSVFTVKTSGGTNASGGTFVAYLFATCAGVSKMTTFTGNGSSQTINCGFTGGARFVLIKRVDSTGNWVTFDTARGIVSGNDPALYLNSTAAEVTGVDAIDPDSTGFIVNQESTFNLNVSSATYLVLAIA